MVNNYVSPTAKEVDNAQRCSRETDALGRTSEEAPKYFIFDSHNEEPIELPAGAMAVLRNVLEYMARGHGITMFPRLAEVTTMEAADILNVSRPYVIKLLEEGAMPFRMVGRHRRIQLKDLMAYLEESDRKSRAAMDELVALSEELGLYDE